MICTLCPRNCRAERTETAGAGLCRMGTLPRIARAALHMWEEPCISGTRGSGAVFFSGCNLRCAFCQNEPISHGGQGETVILLGGKIRIFQIHCHRVIVSFRGNFLCRNALQLQKLTPEAALCLPAVGGLL